VLDQGRAAGVLAQTWRRLSVVHGRMPGSGVLAVVPSLRLRPSYDAVDDYAGLAVYNGLTLLLLEETADLLEQWPAPRTGETVAARRDGVLDDRRGSGVVALRRGRVWLGVATRTRRGSRRHDPRYRVGLAALVVRDRAGEWRSVLPAPPTTGAATPALPVPVVGGARCTPAITATSGRRGRLVLRGRWRCGARRLPLRVELRPSGGGVTLSLDVARGWRLAGGIDLPGDARRTRGGARWSTGRIALPRGAAIARPRRLATPSSSHAQLRRLTWALRIARGRRATVRIDAR